MIATDTNVLARILVDDPGAPEQCAVARAAVAEQVEVYVPQAVQAELSWVLGTAFGFGRRRIAVALEHLRDNVAFRLQHPDTFRRALERFAASSTEFADCLILTEARAVSSELLTFDRKLGEQRGARRLG